jgi:hypothetical protein
MIKYLKPFFIVAIAVVLASLGSTPASASANVSFGFFYSNLSPHGSWLVSAEYGRVWQPYVYRGGWNPYYDGHWAYSDCGWVWVSDYGWGAIPYHYGTWVMDPEFGWVWVPGTIWAPSWVVFRTGPDYIGWAPVSPRFSLGFSFRSYEPAPDLFVFVGTRHFLSPRIRTAVVRDSRRGVILNSTRIVNNITVENNVVVNRGPDVRSIERVSGRRVREQRIEDVARVAPGGRIDRSELRVDRRGSQDLRVAEPVSERQPVPGLGQRESRRDGREAAGRTVEGRSDRQMRQSGSRPDRRDAIEPRGETRVRPSRERNDGSRRETQRIEPRSNRERQPRMNVPRDRPDRQTAPRVRERERPPRPERAPRGESRPRPEHHDSHGGHPKGH